MNFNNNFKVTIIVTIAQVLFWVIFLPISYWFVLGIVYAQMIEWFVHGWIQHHPFKIFKSYRDNHTYHHKHPNEPLAVQPVLYYIFGSIILLLPFYKLEGFYFGYFITYLLINVIHHDLHTDRKILAEWIWNTRYFKWITTHHQAHHRGTKLGYTTHSVTNPFMDVVFSKIRLAKMNNWIAKRIKI